MSSSTTSRPSDPKQLLVWRYFNECHRNMDASLFPDLFHPDFHLNAPNGGRIDYDELVRVNTEQFWPMIKPGSMELDLSFQPLLESPLPEAAASHPVDELVRFRASVTAERREPAPETNSTELHHEVANVWRIVEGLCHETWPAFDPEKNDEDLKPILDQVGKK